MSIYISCIILLAVSTSLTIALPASSGYKNWEELLFEDGIFEEENNKIHGNIHDEANVLFQLRTLVNNRDALERIFLKYGEMYNKEEILAGDLSRIGIFKKALLDVAKHNLEAQKGIHSYNKGINQFSDMTSAEFYAKYSSPLSPEELLGNNSSTPYTIITPNTLKQYQQLPETVNWRDRGKVTPAKNQGTCNSCATFASTALLESVWAIAKGTDPVSLSAQQVLDCTGKQNVCPTWFNNGEVANYVTNNGIVSWNEYPYEGVQGRCRVAGKTPIAQASSWGIYSMNNGGPVPESDLQGLVANGPVWVRICHETIQSYEGNGIFDGPCGCSPFHFVVVVGYGVRDGVDYWLIKNSWGQRWGDEGFLWLRRNADRLCSVTDFPLVFSVN